jgi:hypothetical protein
MKDLIVKQKERIVYTMNTLRIAEGLYHGESISKKDLYTKNLNLLRTVICNYIADNIDLVFTLKNTNNYHFRLILNLKCGYCPADIFLSGKYSCKSAIKRLNSIINSNLKKGTLES